MDSQPREILESQYREALRMAEEARKHCYGRDGNLLALIKGPDGETRPNPYIPEWYRAVNLSRQLAKELGGDAEEVKGPLLASVLDGDEVNTLQTLSTVLADAIDNTSGHGLAALSKVFLDIQREIREVRGYANGNGVVDEIVGRKSVPNARRLSVV